MNTRHPLRHMGGLVLCFSLIWSSSAFAQTFISGSTGALGNVTIGSGAPAIDLPSDGVLNYGILTVNGTMAFNRNAANTPVTILATGDVTINGWINVDGSPGIPGSSSIVVNPGSLGGPGGFTGGRGGVKGAVSPPYNISEASAGQGPGGGSPGAPAICYQGHHGTYGALTSFVSLIPLFGGSGGSGTCGYTSQSGDSGGGGGGAIVIASSTNIIVNSTGWITANGGAGTGPPASGSYSGYGSGGAIRLVAPYISFNNQPQAQIQATGGQPGRIRLEALTFGTVATTNPVTSNSNILGPVTAASVPALTNLPTLRITKIGVTDTPPVPSALYTPPPDVSLPGATTNPVTVTVAVTNTPDTPTPPDTSVVYVFLVPPSGPATSYPCPKSGGNSFSSWTCTTTVPFPVGQTSVLNVSSSFTIP